MEYVEYYQDNINYVLFYWYITKLHNKDILVRENYHYKTSLKGGICIHGSYIERYLNISKNEQKKLIEKIYELWFVKQWNVNWYSWEPDEDYNTPLKEIFPIDDDWINKLEDKYISSDDLIIYELVVDDKEIRQYLNDYIEEWKDWVLYTEGKNYLNFKSQIDSTVNLIYKKIKRYSHKALWINKSDYSLIADEEINILASLMYLEDIKTIKIRNIEALEQDYWSKYQLWFRIEILDKFFDYFEEKTQSKIEEKKENLINFKYNEDIRNILLNGIEVPLSTNQNEYLKLLLDLDIESLSVNFEDLVLEFESNYNQLDKDKQKKELKRYYNAFNQLNKKIKLDTQIDKLFITTSINISLNPEYTINIIE